MARIAPVSVVAAAMQQAAQNDSTMAVWIADGELRIGHYPQVKHRFDFAEEKIAGWEAPEPPPIAVLLPALDEIGGRHTGDYWFTVLDQRRYFKSGKALLVGALRMIEEARPGTLLKLEKKKGRTKRPVAQDPRDLYENPELGMKFALELAPGWYVATNNNFNEVRKFVRMAAQLAGLNWEKDAILKFNR